MQITYIIYTHSLMHVARMSWSKLLFDCKPRALLRPSTSGSKNTDQNQCISFVALPLSSCLAVRKTLYPGTSSSLACVTMHKQKSMYYAAYSPHYFSISAFSISALVHAETQDLNMVPWLVSLFCTCG